jgi:hypothetical protein
VALARLQDQVRFFADADKDAAVKRHAADLAEAKAFLAALGSVDQRKMTAKVETERLEFDAIVAEAVVRGSKAKIRAVEAEIDVRRTQVATVRAELAVLGYGATGRDGEHG